MHPWLGRRLRITRISHKGQRRYVNAVIVFHDPAESHPFHVLHDDGASAWLAIQESLGVVHAVEGDGGSPRLRTRVSRRFTWLTPVVRREVAGERHPAFGANPERSPWLNSYAAARNGGVVDAEAANAAGFPGIPLFGPSRASLSRLPGFSFAAPLPSQGHETASVPLNQPGIGATHSRGAYVPHPSHMNRSGGSFGSLLAQSLLAAQTAERPHGAFPPPRLASHSPGPNQDDRSAREVLNARVDEEKSRRNAPPNAERSPWDGILEEFGGAPAPAPNPNGGAEGDDPGVTRDTVDLEALEAAARAVGAAAADVDDDGAADDARNIDTRFVSDADAARFRLDAPALSLRAMRVDVRARALEDAASVLMPASLALCAAAMREKRFPPSGSGATKTRAGAFTDRERCAGCDSRLALSFGFRACALCGEAACADCLRERRDALAAELARGEDQDPERRSGSPGSGSPGSGSPGTDAADYVFLCVATPTCLASATAAARRAGLRPAPTFSARRPSLDDRSKPFTKTSVDYFTVSSLRAAGGFRSVAGVLVSPSGTRATSPVANVRLNTLANADDALSIAPACVRVGDAYARFRAEARWGADGTAAGDAASPALVFALDARVPVSFMERLETNADAFSKKSAKELFTKKRGSGEDARDERTACAFRSRKRRRTGAADAGVGDGDSNQENRENQENDDEDDDDDDDDDSTPSTPTFEDSFPSLSAAASRLAFRRAGAGELAADAADAGAAAREARLLFETHYAGDGDAGRLFRAEDDSSSLFRAMRDGRPLMATTTVGLNDDDDDDDDETARETNDARAKTTKKPPSPRDAEPGPGRATRRRFVFGEDFFSDETETGNPMNPMMNPMNPMAATIVSALATTPFAALVHPLGALNVMAYSRESRHSRATAANETNPTEKEKPKAGSRLGAFFDAEKSQVVSESAVEAAPFVGFADARPGIRALENVILETCTHRDDVAVSLGMSALDACFFAAKEPPEEEVKKDVDGNKNPARFWTVFRREDAPLLARWLALRGSALDEPCLAFEAQREARETAAALAAAARAARALADVDPKAGSSEAADAEAAAEAAKEAAERAARAAFDAAAGVSPRLAASALRRRDAFILDDVSLEHLRRDVGVTPAWRNVAQHPGETFFVPAGCPRFAVAARAHVVARFFFLSAGSVPHALRLAHQSRFLPSGHPERGDAPQVRAAVARAAMQMEARVREIERLKSSEEEEDNDTKTGDEGVFEELEKPGVGAFGLKDDAPRRERVEGRETSSLNPIVA